ncbi:MAG: response regulator [Verrucomicrobiota bacterium]
MIHKNKVHILCVEDEAEVLEAILRDLAQLEDYFPIECAKTANEAKEVIQVLLQKRQHIGLILCDHIMPGQNGVDFLIEIHEQDSLRESRKVLLTGQAGQEATIEAVNQAELNHYIAKPWQKENLVQVAKSQLSEYIIDNHINPTPYMAMLDQALISEAVRKGNLLSDN